MRKGYLVNKRILSLSLLLIVLIGAVVYWMSKDTSKSSIKSAVVDMNLNNSSLTKKQADNNSLDNSPPPWLGSTANGPTIKSVDGNVSNDILNVPNGTQRQQLTGIEQSKKRLADLEKLQAEVNASVQNGQPDLKKLSATLYKMKETQGSTVGGVNLNALITNLEKAQQIQELAFEMQKESGKAGNSDQKKLDANMKKMQQLQSEMRTDIMVSPTTNANKSK